MKKRRPWTLEEIRDLHRKARLWATEEEHRTGFHRSEKFFSDLVIEGVLRELGEEIAE